MSKKFQENSFNGDSSNDNFDSNFNTTFNKNTDTENTKFDKANDSGFSNKFDEQEKKRDQDYYYSNSNNSNSSHKKNTGNSYDYANSNDIDFGKRNNFKHYFLKLKNFKIKSIKWKLIIMYIGLVLLIMMICGSYILLSVRNNEYSKSRSQLELYADKISEQVLDNSKNSEFQDLLLQTLPNTVGMQGNILDNTGTTLASTTALNAPFPDFTDYAIVGALNQQSTFSSGKKSLDSFGLLTEWLSFAKPIINTNGDVVYVVYTKLDIGAMQENLSQTAGIIAWSILAALVLASIMGYIFARSLTVPIVALTNGAKKLADGDLNQTLTVNSLDEIGQLTNSFNEMAKELRNSMEQISGEKKKLEILLHNMSDGVISFSKDGEFMLANSATNEMLVVDKFDMDFADFIKAFDISSGVYIDIGIEENSKEVTFPVGTQYIKAKFTPYYNNSKQIEGLVVVLQDITEQKKLDDMRKEFVANVSHELRTPLTNVKSYTETLRSGAVENPEDIQEFLEIIDSEADRMALLVGDLLQLSRFDNKQVHLDISEIELNSFLDMLVSQNMIHADAKQQSLSFEPSSRDIIIYGDEDRIAQVINNILTNAIKYSLNRAKISLYTDEDDLYYKVHIKDTGMGIARENLPRIFERFYRVDKARIRMEGGTGLGLAIAKEIMEIHNGKLTVESDYGKGTTMSLWFLKSISFGESDGW